MIARATRLRLLGQAAYAGAALLILFLRLLPLAPGRVPWPGPDLILCLTLAWVLRRPEQVPALVIAAVVLAEDLLLTRPIGLWAAIVVAGSEVARGREARWREQPFVVEWLRVAVLMALMMAAARLAMLLVLLPVPPLGQVLLHWLASTAAYPLVVLAGAALMGLRRAAPGETERMG